MDVLNRPAALATDEATSLSVWQRALETYEASILVNLYPTSPVRDGDLIDAVIGRFQEEAPTCCSIYKKHGSTRKAHNIILLPSLDLVAALNKRLAAIGNLKSDGRQSASKSAQKSFSFRPTSGRRISPHWARAPVSTVSLPG